MNPVSAPRFVDLPRFTLHPHLPCLALASDWLLILLSFAVASVFPYWPAWVVIAILIARTQLALAVLMHEAAHNNLINHPRWNLWLGQALAASPLWMSLPTYQAGHLKHHRHPMVHDDPVALVFGVNDYPQPRHIVVLRLLRDLSGLGFFYNLWRMQRGDFRHALPVVKKQPGWRGFEVGSAVAVHALLLAYLVWLGHPWFYLWLWVIPSCTLLPFMGRMRAIMEHAGLGPMDDQRLNARTIVRPNWQTFLFGPHGIHYHIEHHLYPGLPFYQLPAVHAHLNARGCLPAANLYRGYGAILRDVSQPTRESDLASHG